MKQGFLFFLVIVLFLGFNINGNLLSKEKPIKIDIKVTGVHHLSCPSCLLVQRALTVILIGNESFKVQESDENYELWIDDVDRSDADENHMKTITLLISINDVYKKEIKYQFNSFNLLIGKRIVDDKINSIILDSDEKLEVEAIEDMGTETYVISFLSAIEIEKILPSYINEYKTYKERIKK